MPEHASRLKKLKLHLVNVQRQKTRQHAQLQADKQIRDPNYRPCNFAQATAITQGKNK